LNFSKENIGTFGFDFTRTFGENKSLKDFLQRVE